MRKSDKTLERLFKKLFAVTPFLPGSISEQYNVCGNPNCRCKDKVNPRRHGPQHKLSYTLNGKNSTIFVKPRDVGAVNEMNEAYREFRQLTKDIADESLRLCKEETVSVAMENIRTAIANAKVKTGGGKPESAMARDIRHSRDNWRRKALERQARIAKNRIRIRDLEKSRESWKRKALSDQATVNELKKSLHSARTELKAKQNGDNKKNGRHR